MKTKILSLFLVLVLIFGNGCNFTEQEELIYTQKVECYKELAKTLCEDRGENFWEVNIDRTNGFYLPPKFYCLTKERKISDKHYFTKEEVEGCENE